MKIIMICTALPILMTELRMTVSVGHVARGGRREIHTGFWWWTLKERDHQ